jgi:hypothetical protein
LFEKVHPRTQYRQKIENAKQRAMKYRKKRMNTQ